MPAQNSAFAAAEADDSSNRVDSAVPCCCAPCAPMRSRVMVISRSETRSRATVRLHLIVASRMRRDACGGRNAGSLIYRPMAMAASPVGRDTEGASAIAGGNEIAGTDDDTKPQRQE